MTHVTRGLANDGSLGILSGDSAVIRHLSPFGI